jgi:hypothetical protein
LVGRVGGGPVQRRKRCRGGRGAEEEEVQRRFAMMHLGHKQQ